jgi:hypothetical protein
MSRQYSPRNFLRQAPNELLTRYFHERDLLLDIDIASLDETDIDPVFQAWERLPDDRRTGIDSDFRMLDALADEEGIKTILDEGRFHGDDLEPAFAPMEGFHDKVLWTFLEHPGYVEIAARFREADELPRNYWLRRKDVPQVEPKDDPATCDELASAVGAYFRQSEGRGYSCTVEVYKRGKAHYFFAYPEDYGRTQIEYERGRLERRPHRPAFEVIFVYSQGDGTLDTFFRGGRQTVRNLQEIFARVVLQRELGDPAKDERVYELNRLKRRDFSFRYDPGSGIQDVRVKLLRLSFLGERGRRITIEADPSRRRDAVYDLLDQVMDGGSETGAAPGSRIPLALVNVTRAGIQALFAKEGKRGRPTRTFFLSYPNACTLGQDGKDAVLRRMLVDSGIEPVIRPSSSEGT